jgi:hypothetical protein
MIIVLSKNKKRKTFSVHRLVADAFCKKTINGTEVNHIDGNRLNNKSSNLEWCTKSQNITHSYIKLKRKGSHQGIPGRLKKSVLQISLDGFILNEFDSITTAGDCTNTKRHHIGKCVLGKRKNAGGFIWL